MSLSQPQTPAVLAPAMPASQPSLDDSARETAAVRTPLEDSRADREGHPGHERRGEDDRQRKDTFHEPMLALKPILEKVWKILPFDYPSRAARSNTLQEIQTLTLSIRAYRVGTRIATLYPAAKEDPNAEDARIVHR